MIQQTIEQLTAMRLHAMAEGIRQQSSLSDSAQYSELTFEERLALIVEKQWIAKENTRSKRRIRLANVMYPHADLEDLEFDRRKGVTKQDIFRLRQGNWIEQCHNVILSGPTGVGKSHLASALVNHFCRMGRNVTMIKSNQLIGNLLLARSSSATPRGHGYLLKSDLVVIDEWMREPLNHEHARELLDFIDLRYQKSSFMFCSQFPVEDWHARFQDPTLADAVLDRVIHNSYRLNLAGESMRKVFNSIPMSLEEST